MEVAGLHFAYRPLRPNPVFVRTWRPAELPSGRLAVFHGYFDNLPEVAARLGCSPQMGLPAIYGLAVDEWGDEADRIIIGDYCAVIADRQNSLVRLSRSPLRAPPLHYHHGDGLVAASSVPRAILATGIDRRLNHQKAADSALLNFTDEDASWFENIMRVPLGSVVELRPANQRRVRAYYDLFKVPPASPASPEIHVMRMKELLGEAVRLSLSGSITPGSTLSSGLDSSQVVVHALNHLPNGQKLPTFTFHPEDGWDGIVEPGMIGNERPMVEAFARMHPGIEPHFTDNAGYEHDYCWNELFHLMGGAPSGLCNMYVFHGLFKMAREQGCDRLLLAEWGNFTFSDKGDWGYVEYLLKGRFGQLYKALAHRRNDRRSMLRRFLALSIVPLLPHSLWTLLMRVWHRGDKRWLDLMTPLSKEFREVSGADERFRKSGLQINRYQPWNRRHAQRLLFQNKECDTAEIYQAFEQLYGVAQRDPTAYRPLVEYCFGLPVDVFMRDGEPRWLAKQMAKGIMPEDQRANHLNGRWDADWHLRIGRRRDDYLAEMSKLEDDTNLSSMLDLPRLRAALETMGETTLSDDQEMFPVEFAVPRALLTARFIRYIEGRNDL